LVGALLVDLEEAHLHPRGGVHGDGEVHADGRAHPGLLLGVGQQVHHGVQRAFAHALEGGDLPHQRALPGLVLGAPAVYGYPRGGGGGRHGDLDDHRGGAQLLGEVRGHLEVGQQLGLALLHDVGQQAEGLRGGGHAVAHQLELAVRGDEGDGALRVELAQPHASALEWNEMNVKEYINTRQ
jgi:hypothetical protein